MMHNSSHRFAVFHGEVVKPSQPAATPPTDPTYEVNVPSKTCRPDTEMAGPSRAI
jgi:hypothetical protein